MKMPKLIPTLILSLLCNADFALAEEPQGEPQAQPNPQTSGAFAGRRHHGPPPEAYTACEGKSPGDTASFTNRRGEAREGVCQTDENGKLVVRRHRQPSQ